MNERDEITEEFREAQWHELQLHWKRRDAEIEERRREARIRRASKRYREAYVSAYDFSDFRDMDEIITRHSRHVKPGYVGAYLRFLERQELMISGGGEYA
jgi:hypothetical protein